MGGDQNRSSLENIYQQQFMIIKLGNGDKTSNQQSGTGMITNRRIEKLDL